MLPPEEMNAFEQKWADVTIIKSEELNTALIIHISGVVLFFILLLLWKNRVLNRLVNIKTGELEQLNKELETLAYTDSLTQLYNRRYFFEFSEHLVLLSKRESNPLSLIMIDIDHFKSINDRYGHDVGDQVIKALSDRVSEMIRKSDLLARFGGEEFVLLLPGTDLDGAVIIAEKIREMIEGCRDVERVSFTISIGISQFFYQEEGLDTLIVRSDRALYQAKNSGRNKVCVVKTI